MKNFAPQQTLVGLLKKRQAALVNNKVKQGALRRNEKLYASKGQAKKFYALMAQLKEEQGRIMDDLEQYDTMMSS